MDRISIGDGLRAYAEHELERAARQLGRPGDERHAGVHQGRKAIRRTRAVLALCAEALASAPAADRLDRELRGLCRGLSALRDADALRDGLLQLARDAVIGPIECERLLASVAARRAERLAVALRRDPDFARRRERLQRGREALDTLPWAAVTDTVVVRGHARSLKRVEQARRRAVDSDDPEDWHRLRRRLRRLRQQESALAEVAPGADWETPGLGELAERMGLAQDHALLLARCRRHGLFAARDRATLRRLVEPLYRSAQEHAVDALAALGRLQREAGRST